MRVGSIQVTSVYHGRPGRTIEVHVANKVFIKSRLKDIIRTQAHTRTHRGMCLGQLQRDFTNAAS